MAVAFQAQLETEPFDDPTPAELAAEMRRQRPAISRLLAWADELARSLQTRPLEPVLCHTDIHAGNLHLPSDGAAWPVSLYIVGWDNPIRGRDRAGIQNGLNVKRSTFNPSRFPQQ
jgi:spectinomycin phosphotransferase